MPLIIMTGIPASGKTTRTKELKKYFEEKGKEVFVVSEYEEILKAGFEKNSVYSDSSKEKHIRGLLKSEVLRLIGPKTVVILDALNYIKGYRYELYCGSKANKCTQCVVHTEINRDVAWNFNENRENNAEKYDQTTFKALLMRYENPEHRNRWDSPLFIVFPEQNLNTEVIYDCLLEKKPPPPNMSTQNPPLSSTNFLYDLDKVTKEITDHILKARNVGVIGEYKIPGYDNLALNITNVTTSKLMLLRRQYITYSKMHVPEVSQVPQLYVQYLKSSLN